MFRKGASTAHEYFDGRHRLEHWYRDNTVYFLTVRCTNKFHAFKSEQAKQIFWRQLERYTKEYGFEIWVCSLLDNHYHALGFLPKGNNLSPMLKKIHGSVAKLVNDLLPQRLLPFWSKYFDGCLRDEKQYRRAYRYTQTQSVRHGICADWQAYPHTRVHVALEEGLSRAVRSRAFLPQVPYKRYSDMPTEVGKPR
jgi:REP element-mobilizing transposase RayT